MKARTRVSPKRRRRVLVISHSAVASPYQEKWRILSALGPWNLRLLLPERGPEGGKMLEAARPASGLEVRVLRPRFAGRIGFFSLRGLGEAMQEFHPELVYAEEEPYSICCLEAARLAKRLGAPFAFFSWENIARSYKPPLNWVKRRVFSLSSGAVLGNEEAFALCAQDGFQGRRALIPQYGIDPKAFHPKRRRGPFRAGYVGRLVWEKGVDLFLEACALAGVEAIVVGQGPEEAALRALAARLGAKVEFRPFVPFERRHEIYREFDVLILPSRSSRTWKEQFGRVLIEAAAMGLPSVATKSGAIPEVLGEGGLLVPENDAASLAAAIKAVQAQSGLKRSLALRARQGVLKRYTEKKLCRSLSDFWEALLEERS